MIPPPPCPNFVDDMYHYYIFIIIIASIFFIIIYSLRHDLNDYLCVVSLRSNFAKRPKALAVTGKPSYVMVNHYPVDIKISNIYHYNVVITPFPAKRASLVRAIYNKIVSARSGSCICQTYTYVCVRVYIQYIYIYIYIHDWVHAW